jgi:hypothetical protein
VLQLEATSTRLAEAAAYTGPYEQYLAAMKQLLVANNLSRIEFTQNVVAGGNPAALRAKLLVTSPQSTSTTLPVTTPVTDVSTLYKWIEQVMDEASKDYHEPIIADLIGNGFSASQIIGLCRNTDPEFPAFVRRVYAQYIPEGVGPAMPMTNSLNGLAKDEGSNSALDGSSSAPEAGSYTSHIQALEEDDEEEVVLEAKKKLVGLLIEAAVLADEKGFISQADMLDQIVNGLVTDE